MRKTNLLALAVFVTGGLVACNGGSAPYSSSWVSPGNVIESPIAPNVSRWTTTVGESDFVNNGFWPTAQFLAYDAKNNVLLGSIFGTIGSSEINEYYLNQGYNSSWQNEIGAVILHWNMDSTSNVTTDNNGMFYLFAQGPDLIIPVSKYLISFNDKTLELHYQELKGDYPSDVDFSNIYYYNGSVYAEESTPGVNTTYSYNLVSFSVESTNFGTYESTLNNVYASNNQWYTKISYRYMLTHSYAQVPLISAVIGDNGNMYVNDHGQIAEIPLNNPASIRKIGTQLGDGYENDPYPGGYKNLIYLSPIAYNNGKVYSCGQVGSDVRVQVIVSLPVTAGATKPWEPIGYTWLRLMDNGSPDFYIGCDSITSNGNKIFVEGGYAVPTVPGGGGDYAVYESDISTTFNQQGQ